VHRGVSYAIVLALSLGLGACDGNDGTDAGAPDGGALDAGADDAGPGPDDAGDDAATGGCAGGCGMGRFCETTPGMCASTDERCSVVPELCPPGGEPVCGCDGTTYPSDCERRRASASKAFDGACEAIVCDPPCTGGLVCWYVEGAAMMGCGVMGACALPTPIFECDFAPEEPVCGCDGTTYRHIFCAQTMGIAIESTGACP